MKVTRKGQVTIPVAIRKKIGLLPHMEVEFVFSGGNLVLKKSSNERARGHRLVAALRGRATRKMSTDQIMALTRSN